MLIFFSILIMNLDARDGAVILRIHPKVVNMLCSKNEQF